MKYSDPCPDSEDGRHCYLTEGLAWGIIGGTVYWCHYCNLLFSETINVPRTWTWRECEHFPEYKPKLVG